jgi:hypothetical protein
VPIRCAASFGDGFPDEFGDIEHQRGVRLAGISGRAHLANAHADHVIETAVTVAVTKVKDGADDLPAARWVGAAVSVTLEQDCLAVVGLNGCPEVRTEGPGVASALRKIRTSKATGDGAFAAALGQEQVLFPSAFEPDRPALGISEANAVQLLESHAFLLAASQPVGACQADFAGPAG